MYYVIVYLLALGTTYFLLERYRQEWINAMKKHWAEMNYIAEIVREQEKKDADHFLSLSQRLSQMESLLNRAIQEMKETPEKKSKDTAQRAVDEILRSSW